MHRECLEHATALARAREWARPFQPRVLQRALLVFRLNAHGFDGGRSAIFAKARVPPLARAPVLRSPSSPPCPPHASVVRRAQGSKFAHSCASNSAYSGTARAGHGCHVATRPIRAGELLTTNYLGEHSLAGTRLRQALLARLKLFHCQCARCVAPDWCSRTPCPACHPRNERGELPTMLLQPGMDGRVSYALMQPVGVDDVWLCGRCGGKWGADAMGAERAASERVHATQQQLRAMARAGNAVPPPHADVAVQVSVVARSVGIRHWATAALLDLQNRCLLAELDAGAALDAMPTPAKIERLVWNSAAIWRHCAGTRGECAPARFPHSFGAVVDAIERHGTDSAPAVSAELLVRSLAAAGHSSLPATDRLLRRLGAPATAEACATLLLSAGNTALSDGKPGEALTFLAAASVHGGASAWASAEVAERTAEARAQLHGRRRHSALPLTLEESCFAS
jgi:hypothetical protein